ncbi:hypothetical protein HXC34_14355 [Listeria monocytogenes]|nr:hypothetical protein [Listeria monocytogenes]
MSFEANADRSMHGVGAIIIASIIIALLAVALPELIKHAMDVMNKYLDTGLKNVALGTRDVAVHSIKAAGALVQASISKTV